MVAKEFIDSLEPVFLEGFDDHGEEEETLSLCDLARSSNVEEHYWSEFSYKDGDGKEEEEDFFEFSSEDFTASTYPKPNQNTIIFCGKLIPFKGDYNDQEAAHDYGHHQTQNHKYSTLQQQKPTKNSNILGWNKSKKDHQRHDELAKSCDFKYDKKASPSTSRSRWYSFAFGSFGKGISGYSTRMELRDIRSRQSRRRVAAPTTMFRSDGSSGGGGDLVKRGEKRSENKGLWRLLRILGCKGRRTNAMVKASFSCIPHV